MTPEQRNGIAYLIQVAHTREQTDNNLRRAVSVSEYAVGLARISNRLLEAAEDLHKNLQRSLREEAPSTQDLLDYAQHLAKEVGPNS